MLTVIGKTFYTKQLKTVTYIQL